MLVSGHAYALNASDPLPIGPEGGWVTALAASPTFDSDGRAWAATFGGHMFSGTNGAGSWSPSHAGETDPVVEALTASPSFSADSTVFAAADEGVFKSTDAGNSWTLNSAGLGHHFCRVIVLSPSFASDHMAFVATDGGVYRSTDSGVSWSAPLDGTGSVISLAEVTSGSDAGTLLAGLDTGGLEESVDGGAHWQAEATFPTSRRVLSIVSLLGSGSSSFIAGTDDGIWRQAGTGLSWQQVGASGDRVDTLAVGRAPSPTALLYAGSGGGHGVYISSDGGTSWRQVGAPAVPFVTSLVYTGASSLLAGTAGGGISVSMDDGYSWKQSSHGLLAFQVQGLKAIGNSLVVSGNGGAFERGLAGSSWQPLAIPSHFVTSMDGNANDRFAGTQDMGLLISNDAGASWRQSSLPTGTVGQVAMAPSADKTILVAGDYVYRSVDSGLTFAATNLPGNDVRSFSFSPSFSLDGTAFAGTVNHGVYRSVDRGMSWQSIAGGLPAVPIMSVLTSSSFSRDGTVYAATAGKGIYVSSNRGTDWTPLSPSVPDSVVDALAWTESGVLVAGTDRGVYLMQSNGWSPLATGWDVYVSALQDVLDRGTEYLYAGTTGQGVWVATLNAPPSAATDTSVPVPAPSSTVPAAPTTTLVATKTPGVAPTSRPTPSTRPLKLRLRVDPVPVVANRLALLTASGPAGGRIQLSLQAGAWHRRFSGSLAKDGRLAFGFVSPPASIIVSGQMMARGHTVSSKILVPVLTP